MDKSEAIEIVVMLRTLIHNLDIRPIWEFSHIENVKPSSTAFVLSKAIQAIEYLVGELEDCEEANEEDEEALEYWKKRCFELVRSRDNVVEYWTKHCENLLHTHRKSLAEKDREIYKLKQELNSLYGKINNPANFCGNCKYCVKGSTGYHCEHSKVIGWTVDPDDASCPCFKSNQVDRDKPDQPCCKACNREDCDDCTLCPF